MSVEFATKLLTIRVKPSTLERWKQLADAAGMTLSAWVHLKLNQEQ